MARQLNSADSVTILQRKQTHKAAQLRIEVIQKTRVRIPIAESMGRPGLSWCE